MARKAAEKSPIGVDASTRILVLYGAEQTLMREHLDALRAVLVAAHGEVETSNFDGEMIDLASVLDELRSYGLMQQHKLVIVDNADEFVSKYREAMERYAAQPVDHATLVLRGTRWNKGKLDKLIESAGGLIKCDPLRTPEAVEWLIRRAVQVHHRKLDKATATLLVQRLGVQLGRLDTELAKIAVMVDDGQAIDKAMIEQVVGRGSDEEAWAVQEAVLHALGRTGEGRSAAGEAIASLHEFIDVAGHPDMLVAYFVADLFRKLHLAAAMKRQGVSEGEIGRVLKLWGPRQAVFMNFLRRLDASQAARAFDRLVQLEWRTKSGRGDARRNLEGFCAALADELK